ncbi:MAG: Re/Si-specific NAD(P)(+) transhydrogenase subunit alpha [Gammaproteobacteria bacterium]|nr:MAG: Re/Si-specific NAD(P)(+) transhydrogenase subunit alpha [Gammaproteobacteria bacterium]
MYVGIPRERNEDETRVAATPETVKEMVSLGLRVKVEEAAGERAHFSDTEYQNAGAVIVGHEATLNADIVLMVNKPTSEQASEFKTGAVLVSQMQACGVDDVLSALAEKDVSTFALERIPRISRAQNVDVLSSQSSIGGYRAALKAAELYGNFMPMMMTSAGSSRPAKVMVLGVGVAGLQAMATAKKLGARVYGYDVRPEVKEQVESLGAKFVELDVGEEGGGQGGYAKQLSKETQARQQELLSDEIRKMDIVISTALIPCRPAPILIPEETVKGMKPGSVIIDMAAANGGNCPLTQIDKIIKRYNVKICGITNFPALMPSDASAFYARNLLNFVKLLIACDDVCELKDFQKDEITAATLTTGGGEVCIA